MISCRVSVFGCLFSLSVTLTIVRPNEIPNGLENIRYKRYSHFSFTTRFAECQNIRKACPTMDEDIDTEVISCVLLKELSNEVQNYESCRNKIVEFISDLKLDELLLLLEPICGAELKNVECSGTYKNEVRYYLSCFADNMNSIKDNKCASIIKQLSITLPFVQPLVMNQYLQECERDKETFGCDSSSNTDLLSCLQKHVLSLKKKCQNQILKLSESQGENIKYDRKLFEACAEERQRFCKAYAKTGPGRIYECLLQYRNDEAMSQQCHKELFRHEQLIVQDYQVSKGFVRACREDIRNNHCRKSVSDDRNIRLAQILLCLENATHHNSNSVNSKCRDEMLAHRRMLLEDYRLSPELVTQCSRDISKYCSKDEFGGKTIHCLMENAKFRRKTRISANCLVELENLLKETDIGEDWNVDPIVWKSCQNVASVACNSINQNSPRTLNCLMEKLGTNFMTKDCESSLRQVQYFLARDYKLDPMLFNACNSQAVQYCGANPVWSRSSGANRNMILPCLFRLIDQVLPSPCGNELKRVMRERALNVDLHPNVELVCIDDLARFCNNKTAKGQEILCLQDSLNELKPECKQAVYNFTELQSQFIELNPIITSQCQGIANELCLKKDQDLLECLIEKKNDPLMKAQIKCRAAVEHQQLLSLKDYHFTFKFKRACKFYVNTFCPGPKNKAEVVKCLSEKIRNDTLVGSKQHISKDCHQQLRTQLLQQKEDINLNPKLKSDCTYEISTICAKIPHGNAKILECLISNKNKLGDICHKTIFNIERQVLTDSNLDYTLLNTCKSMLGKFCANLSSSDQPLNCLKKYKYYEEFDYKCRVIVVRRLAQQFSDYRFDPGLQMYCHIDIIRYCAGALEHNSNKETISGNVIKCLKVQFRMGLLSKQCEDQVVNVLQEAALNYKLNPLLSTVCSEEIKNLCQNDNENVKIDKGEVEECLKQALYNGEISSLLCKQEIVELLNEGKADIQTDPVLNNACAKDLAQYCTSVERGAGRKLNCLVGILHGQNTLAKLRWNCKNILKERLEMYKIQIKVDNFGELYGQISGSASKKYFMVVALTFIGMTFISGMFCGKIVRRSRVAKNK